MTTTTNINDIAKWSEPKRVNTRFGQRDLCKAVPGDDFWNAWRGAKQALKEAGVSVSKDHGEWVAMWWRPIPEDEQNAIDEARESSRATNANVDVPSPAGLEYLPYQRAGIAYAMARKNTLIGDEMGLGKTIQAIGLWNAEPVAKTLIVCPASLRLNWRNEFTKWAVKPVKIAVIVGGTAKAWKDAETDEADVVIINYDVLTKHKARLMDVEWDLTIVDECHLVKNPQAARTKALLGYTPRAGQRTQPQPAIPAKRRLFLTGTPIVNRPVELWPILQSIDPTGLGKSFFGYVKRFCDAKQTRWGWDFSGASNLHELQNRLRETVMVRRLKKDVLTELPAKVRQVIELPANGAAAAVAEEKRTWEGYRAYIEELEAKIRQAELEQAAELDDYEYTYGMDEVAEMRRELREARRTAFTEMSKVRHQTALAKAPKVVEHLLTSLEEGPVVCFAHHRDVIAQIQDGVEADKDSEYRVATITGDTPLQERQDVVEAFQAGNIDLIVGNIQAAGVGLTLTASSHVVFAELDWVPGNLSQAEDRCHRIGQQDSVLVQHLVLEDSLDAEMARKLIEKQAVIDEALDRETDAPEHQQAVEEVEVKEVPLSTLDKRAQTLTADQIAAVHEGLQILSGVCDGAVARDDCGFNGVDSRFGKSLAAQAKLSPRQAAIAQNMLFKYHRQLGGELMDRIKGA